MDPLMSFTGEPSKEQDHSRPNSDQFQAIMREIQAHLRVEPRQRKVVQEDEAKRGRVAARNIQEDTQVFLVARQILSTPPNRNSDWKRLGSLKVLCRISPFGYELEFPVSIRIHRVQSIPLSDSVVDDPHSGKRIEPHTPVGVDGEEEYQSSRVEYSRIIRSQFQYLIQWSGYDSLTWEPTKFVDGLQVVDEFHQ